MMDTGAVASAGANQFAGVVAICAPNDHHHITALSQCRRGTLTLFGGLTDGIDKLELRRRKPSLDQLDQSLHSIDGLGGLGHDPEALLVWELGDIRLRQHHIEGVQVPGQPPHLHMVTPSNHDRMTSGLHKGCQRLVGSVNQRAGGINQV
jgi:hypothetical protein